MQSMEKDEISDVVDMAQSQSQSQSAPSCESESSNVETNVNSKVVEDRERREERNGSMQMQMQPLSERPRSTRHVDGLHKLSVLRQGTTSNGRLHGHGHSHGHSHGSMQMQMQMRASRNIVAAANDQEDRNLARMLEDLLNQREQLERSHNWNQYSAVLKVLDEKLEETRLRLFYGRDFDTTFVKKLKRFDDGSDPNTPTWIDIDIPKDRGGHQNLVGRLVGPSGSTIKQLERDLDCKISIRGWALKRNLNLNAEFRNSGVHRSLHDDASAAHAAAAVVEADDSRELYMKATVLPSSCTRTHLEYAKKALEHFVHNAVTTNADFDVLKKWQLIDLSKGRGQYRPVGRRSHRNDTENKPPKAANGTSYDKSVSVPSLSTIQVPVRLIAVPQISTSPSYQMPSVNVSQMLAMPNYQSCYSAVEFQPNVTVSQNVATSASRPVFVAAASSPTLTSQMQVPEAYSASQTQPSTPISLTVASPSITTQSTPSISSADSGCYSLSPQHTSNAVYAATPVQYASYAPQYTAQSYGQTLVCPVQAVYASQPCYAAQTAAAGQGQLGVSSCIADNRYLMLPAAAMSVGVDNTPAYQQQSYVYYTHPQAGYMTSIGNQQASLAAAQ